MLGFRSNVTGRLLFICFAIQTLLRHAFAQSNNTTGSFDYTDIYGNKLSLKDNRTPNLYTGNFGDCQGNSPIKVTRFDVALYTDNMTLVFNLEGSAALSSESVALDLGLWLYGESRIGFEVDPCQSNIGSLCPINSDVPIQATIAFSISQEEISGLPGIAFSLPDVEGQAVLRIFSNSTQSQIACFAAAVTNGATLSHPASIGALLGLFTLTAIVASFATAIHGSRPEIIRRHYAKSLSVSIVFAVLQNIFFTGALSMNWPNILVSFWSNYAWTAGMIKTSSMQSSIDNFAGLKLSNTLETGAAGVGHNYSSGGTFNTTELFSRGVQWYGELTQPGFPLPGNFSGFAGTLAAEGIPLSNAFVTGFVWFLILLLLVGASIIAFKWILELLSKSKIIREDRLLLFRTHWSHYTILVLLRTVYAAFFTVIFLCLLQFTYTSSSGVKALAVIVFLVMMIGVLGATALACLCGLRTTTRLLEPGYTDYDRKGSKNSRREGDKIDERTPDRTLSRRQFFIRNDKLRVNASIHDDELYLKRFGWLSARFQSEKWWFFAVWLVYDFCRACFYAGAISNSLTQVAGILCIETGALVAVILLKPFQGHALNAFMVYVLSGAKIATAALSITFDSRFSVSRVTCAAIGVMIIFIQSAVSIVLLVSILIGAYSTYLSCRANHNEELPPSIRKQLSRFYPECAKKDQSNQPTEKVVYLEPQEPSDAYFKINCIQRVHKIEDEDDDFKSEIGSDFVAWRSTSELSLPNTLHSYLQLSRPNSVHSRPSSVFSTLSHSNLLPHGARPYRPTWNSKDCENLQGVNDSRLSLPLPPPIGEAAGPEAPDPGPCLHKLQASWRNSLSLPRKAEPSPLRNASSNGEDTEANQDRFRPKSQPAPSYVAVDSAGIDLRRGPVRLDPRPTGLAFHGPRSTARNGKRQRPQRAISYIV